MGARAAGFAPPSYTTTRDTTRRRGIDGCLQRELRALVAARTRCFQTNDAVDGADAIAEQIEARRSLLARIQDCIIGLSD